MHLVPDSGRLAEQKILGGLQSTTRRREPHDTHRWLGVRLAGSMPMVAQLGSIAAPPTLWHAENHATPHSDFTYGHPYVSGVSLKNP
jgi:hypothetical protein